jgi:hypothetical protein
VRTALWIVVAALAVAGCGGDEESPASADATPDATATPTPTPTETPERAPKRARSVRGCAELWNADAIAPENYQVSANEFVAELAPVRVHVAYQPPDCFVVAPIGNRRIAIFAAANGRRPYSVPDRRRLKPGERVPYNARGRGDGTVVLD